MERHSYDINRGFGTWEDGSFKQVSAGRSMEHTYFFPGTGPWSALDFDGVVKGCVELHGAIMVDGEVNNQQARIFERIRHITCGGLHTANVALKNLNFLRNLESIEDYFSCAHNADLTCISGLAGVEIGGPVYFDGTAFAKIETATDIPQFVVGG